MNLSDEEQALVGLSTLGADEHFRPPALIVKKGSTEPAAKSLKKELLVKLWEAGLVCHVPEVDGYALTRAGAKKVMELVLVSSKLTPLEALEALLKVADGISLGKADEGRIAVRVRLGTTAFMAVGKDLEEAVTSVKSKIDQMLLG